MFIPSPSTIIPGGVETVRLGGLLFLQYDWIVVNVSCALWVYFFIHTNQIFPAMKGQTITLPLILFSVLILEPGGAVCGALWIREKILRLEYGNLHSR
jgi:hypothetical protein